MITSPFSNMHPSPSHTCMFLFYRISRKSIGFGGEATHLEKHANQSPTAEPTSKSMPTKVLQLNRAGTVHNIHKSQQVSEHSTIPPGYRLKPTNYIYSNKIKCTSCWKNSKFSAKFSPVNNFPKIPIKIPRWSLRSLDINRLLIHRNLILEH